MLSSPVAPSNRASSGSKIREFRENFTEISEKLQITVLFLYPRHGYAFFTTQQGGHGVSTQFPETTTAYTGELAPTAIELAW